ncbi:hypothetical protein EPI10_033268 [Gossypium australe]|uniref:Uncharacterized protein n=1 Tax=Gossypium australe TaxID=47621 RepID=A0A5B6X762_9ROSI|nr:hypothetical protein EPI10_033268 [Gossypium australe]
MHAPTSGHLVALKRILRQANLRLFYLAMASSLALTRLVSSNILPSPLRVAIAPSNILPSPLKAEVKNGVLKSGPSFLRRRRRRMM